MYFLLNQWIHFFNKQFWFNKKIKIYNRNLYFYSKNTFRTLLTYQALKQIHQTFKIQLDSLEMKKILQQKQFIAKDHYFLPEDDQSDIQSNQQIQSFNENPPKSRIQIQNFTENGSIKINIEIDNQDFSQLKVISRAGKWKKPIKNTQNQQKQKIQDFQKSYESFESHKLSKILTQNDQISKTPVRNPVYHDDNNYCSNSSAQTVKAHSKYFYSHEHPFKDQHIFQNSFKSDMKNKRYFNTDFFNQSWGKQKTHDEDSYTNFEKTNDNSPLKSQNILVSSFYTNHLEQKPFFSAPRAKISEKVFQIQVQQNQQVLQFEKQKFNTKISIREQISEDYISGQNSKKRFQALRQDFIEKEIQSQIFLQNHHLSRQIHEQEKIPQVQIEEYIFGGSCYRKSNKNEQSVSQICEQNQKDQRMFNPLENEFKNSFKPQTIDNDQGISNEKINKILLDFQEQSDMGSLKQNSLKKESLKSFDSKISQENINQNEQQKIQGRQLVETFEDYHFQEPQYEKQNFENKEVQIQPVLKYHQSSQKSDQQRQMDEMSQIQKLRESQIQAFSMNIDQTNTFQSQIQNQTKFYNQNHVEEEQKDQRFTEKQNHFQTKKQDFIIIQQQTQSQKSQNAQQLTYTFAPPKQAQNQQNQKLFHPQQQPTKVQWQLEKQKQISSKIKKRQQNKLSQRTTTEEGYSSKKSRSRSKQNFIPFSKKSKPHHHQQHCFQPKKPRPFIFNDYSTNQKAVVSQQFEPKSSRSQIQQQQKINKISPIKQPKIVRVNLVNKRAQDLFTKHKNQFLDKLKSRQNYINQQISTPKKSRSKEFSNNKNSVLTKSKKITTQNSSKNRPVSPFIRELSQRLYSRTSQPLCQHYKKHSKRDLRERFFSLISEDKGYLLKQYYFSSQELHEIFVEKILNKELNENYWIEIVKKQGQKKLQNLRLRSKQKYHPNQRLIIRKQQLDADSKRAYPSTSPFIKNFYQKIQTK